jgi:hypothetical protein
MSHPEVFLRALRAATAVTGLLKHGAIAGVAAGTLVAGACAPAASPSRPAPDAPEVQADTGATARSEPDASPARDCKDDPGYLSACCRAAEAMDQRPFPVACIPWGPPAPPAYQGERIDRGAEQVA